MIASSSSLRTISSSNSPRRRKSKHQQSACSSLLSRCLTLLGAALTLLYLFQHWGNLSFSGLEHMVLVDAASSSLRGGGDEVGASIPIMKSLADSSTFMSTMADLYNKYGAEIATFRPTMKAWCEKTQSCKYTDFEVEMLYMLIRENKPQRVFEMAPNKGYSSHWILQALFMNDETSKLYSYDIHDRSVQHMSQQFQHRWTFTLGDYEELLETKQLDMTAGFDFLFIDALHTEEFSRGYCQKLLDPHPNKAIVVIHDIVADALGGGRESSEVYKFLAWAKNVQNVFTVSRFAMPNLFDPVPNAVEQLHRMRAAHQIVKPCDDNDDGSSCKKALHDPLYFQNNDAPSLFFQLN